MTRIIYLEDHIDISDKGGEERFENSKNMVELEPQSPPTYHFQITFGCSLFCNAIWANSNCVKATWYLPCPYPLNSKTMLSCILQFYTQRTMPTFSPFLSWKNKV